MGNCFSCAGLRGRKNVRAGVRVGHSKKGFQSDGKSSATASTQRSAGSLASQEWEAEAASGFISFGSDISKSFIIPSPSTHGIATTQPQTFGVLLAKEDMQEELDRRDSLAKDSSVEKTPTKVCRDQARDSLERIVTTPTKNVPGLDLLRNSQQTPSVTPSEISDRDVDEVELRNSPPQRPAAQPTSKGDGDQGWDSIPWKLAATPRSKGCLAQSRDSPASLRTTEPVRNSNGSRSGQSTPPRRTAATSTETVISNRSGLDSPPRRPVARKANEESSSLDSSGRQSAASPIRKVNGDRSGLETPRRSAAKSVRKVIRDRSRDHLSRNSPERPVARFYDDLGQMENSPGRPPAEKTDGGHTVVDLINKKGRQELERLRGLSPQNSITSLKKGKPRTESLESIQKSSLQSKEDLPVDFDFLTRKFINDDSKSGKLSQSSQSRELDREPSARIDQNHLAEDDSRSGSLSVREIFDEFSKTYKQSAAKAAARDRDNFKSMSSESTDGSVGSPPPVLNRRKTVSTPPTTHPGLEEEITPGAATFEELLGADSDILVRAAATPSRVRRSLDVNRRGSHSESNHRGMNSVQARTGITQPG